MLSTLQIRNFAIIDDLLVSFVPGLTILSGETGAGKSIIVGALNLVMGERATTDLIRTGESEAAVEALFAVPEDEGYEECLREKGINPDGSALLVKRVISREGKNRVLINGSLATLAMLGDITESLLTISGQHEHQELLRPQNHIHLLDNYAGLITRQEEYRKVFREMEHLREQTQTRKAKQEEEKKRQELLRFQWEEIETAKLLPGEEEDLRQEKKILTNAGSLIRISEQVYEFLYEGDSAILSHLGRKARELREGASIDASLTPQVESLEGAIVQLEDVALSLRAYLHKTQFNPQRLEAIENRLDMLHRLKKKYGASIPEVLAYQDTIKAEMDELSRTEDYLASLQEQCEVISQEVLAKAEVLSRERHTAAPELSRKVEQELTSLGMADARFLVNIKSGESKMLDENGIDQVEFLFSPNPGEELRPLVRIASGGELSRVILSFKHISAQQGGLSTLIFDEVDSGIGGATAEVVGQKLWEISHYYQTICITHLPQIASFGDSHYSISKKVEEGRTKTTVTVLSAEDRVEEISRMLGGTAITPKTRTLAREMLRKRDKCQSVAT